MTEYRPAQIARHVTVVLAGAASLTLTVAAGAYIADQMAGTQRQAATPGGPEKPAAVAPPRAEPAGPDSFVEAVFHGYRVGRPAAPILPGPSEPPAPAAPAVRVAAPQPAPEPRPRAREGVDGRFDVGDGYVGARIEPTGGDTVTVTVDTDLFSGPAPKAEPNGQGSGGEVSRVTTEIDTKRGAMTLAVSDPTLGEHDLHVDRTPAPGRTAPTARI
ncbi:hypothetical protein [Nocardia bovistercoris]|uniref:Uncharacterized protein n=1 Tax=Nocardia bovistercoris TaxID=2785916 RepID=A0A931N402_9NOCA|nr:hypothetical protein [Nocardia bovistercoris]MBH0781205.1 hypothetical protein [Nocardia bovistercoris]